MRATWRASRAWDAAGVGEGASLADAASTPEHPVWWSAWSFGYILHGDGWLLAAHGPWHGVRHAAWLRVDAVWYVHRLLPPRLHRSPPRLNPLKKTIKTRSDTFKMDSKSPKKCHDTLCQHLLTNAFLWHDWLKNTTPSKSFDSTSIVQVLRL